MLYERIRKSNSLVISSTLILLIVLAGIIRTSGLERKFYWVDEVSSYFVISGHWPDEIENDLDTITGQVTPVGKMQELLERQSNNSPKDLLLSLAQKDPQHSPLYFLLAQYWATHFGAAPESLRLVASLFGILSMIAFFWLCIELFDSAFAGLIGVALLTFAPFQILFSQQNREYSLWCLTTILSTAMLLAANRTHKRVYWVGYAISVIAGLYSFLFFLPPLIGHIFYQNLEYQKKPDSRLKAFVVSFGVGIVAFAPWAINIALNLQKVEDLNQWSSRPVTSSLYFQGLVLNVSRQFVDFNLPSFVPLPWDTWSLMAPIYFVFTVVILSLIYTAYYLPNPRRILFVSLFAISLLFLFTLDLAKGGIHSLVARHLMPTWVAVYLAVTFTITAGLKSNNVVRKIVSAVTLVSLVSFGAHFVHAYIPEKIWWPLRSNGLTEIGDQIMSTKIELLILSKPVRTKQLISLAYYLDKKLPLLILDDQQKLPSLKSFNKIALFQPSEEISFRLKTDFTLSRFSDEFWLGLRK